LFTPFERLGAEQSAVPGTGLGLAVCQRLIQEMHGSIGVDSTVTQGSTFWIELARTRSPLECVSTHELSHPAQREEILSTEKRTVLYIEDNFPNLMLVEQMLQERPDIELITAMKGQLGLDLARQHLPDLILLDLHLPDLPGWDVLAQLQAADETRDIPTIVISADATIGQIDRLMTAGARGYLTKPINVTEFLRVLGKTIKTTETQYAAA
jgi:CheY-like chemotaxis protein